MQAFALIAILITAATYAISFVMAQPPATLIAAAGLITVMGLGHSVMGEQKLIGPLMKLPGLPAPRGSVEQTRRILRLSWHSMTLMWWGMGAVLLHSHFAPSGASLTFFWMVLIVFSLSGAAVLGFTRGGHTSWVYFFLVAGLVGHRIAQG